MKRLAAALEAAKSSRSRIAKEEAIGRALASIGADADDPSGIALATAARIATGRTLPIGDGRTLGAGGTLVFESACAVTGWPPEVVAACARRAGDLGEAFGLLVARLPGAEERPGVSLLEVAQLFDELASSGQRAFKRRRLDAMFARTTPLETKYLAKVLLSSLRVGAQVGVIEVAIARGFAIPIEELRRAAALVTDPGELAVLARDGRLGEARLALGRPVAYMLATPIETVASAIDAGRHVAEDKIDGVRTQLHKVGADVSLFARGLERVTTAFPEVVDAFRFAPGSFALDGELVAVASLGGDGDGDGDAQPFRPRPFQALQARLRRLAPTPQMLAETEVAFVAYDILADAEQGDLLALPWTERRARLEAFARDRAPKAAFVLNPYRSLAADRPLEDQLDELFASARARGHEGLVLKKIDAPYDAGRRGQAWLKIKRAFATLDVVVTAAEEGHGRRAGVLSDYTFAVWSGTELVNVGKAYSGLTDEEIDAMTRRLQRITVERFGGVRAVKPEIVLEIAFDGLQRSARHKSGFALRFPRIQRVRDDKRAEEADTLETVERLFASQVESGHREDAPPAPDEPAGGPRRARRATSPRGRASAAPSAQLSLFRSEDEPAPGGDPPPGPRKRA